MKLIPRCSICGNSEFLAFNGRPAVRCANCHSMERSRLMFALLERTGQLKQGISILHFAPEFGVAGRLKPLATRYVTADLETEQYAKVFPDAETIDLSSDDLARFESAFDLILHNHVLEHIPCDLGELLSRLISCLKPDGRMYFTIPIRKDAITSEDSDFSLSADARQKLFGQHDHVRMIGDKDALKVFNQAQGGVVTALDEHDYLSDADLKLIQVPVTRGLTHNTVFVAARDSVQQSAFGSTRLTRQGSRSAYAHR